MLIIIAAAVVLAWLLIKILAKPISRILKFLIHAAFGYVILFVVNFFGSNYGIFIEMNLVNSAITGIFGIPGVAVLALLQFLL